jgi:hypothetical protein
VVDAESLNIRVVMESLRSGAQAFDIAQRLGLCGREDKANGRRRRIESALTIFPPRILSAVSAAAVAGNLSCGALPFPLDSLCAGLSNTKLSVRAGRTGEICDLCISLVTTLGDLLFEDLTGELQYVVNLTCYELVPLPYYSCPTIVDYVVDYITELLAGDVNATVICEALGLCSPDAQYNRAVGRGDSVWERAVRDIREGKVSRDKIHARQPRKSRRIEQARRPLVSQIG